MNDKPGDAEQRQNRLTLKRWSQKKLEAARAPPATQAGAGAAPPPGAQAAPPANRAPQSLADAPLPPIESLTIDSEYGAFFKPHVDEATRRAALKQLFRDPRFNVMDGLDVYIGDYTQPDPIPPEMLKQLAHTRHIFDPPRTEVNAHGHVVDVVDEVAPAQVADATGAAAAIAPGAANSADPAADPPERTLAVGAGKAGDPTPS